MPGLDPGHESTAALSGLWAEQPGIPDFLSGSTLASLGLRRKADPPGRALI